MGPRTEGERSLLLSTVQSSVIYERTLAAQAARISANIDNADHRLEVEAKGLLKRLFHSRQGPIETYGSEQYLNGGERVSYSPIPDDPEDPETLVDSLVRTVPGCRLLLAEWADLRALLEPPGRWQAVHRFRAIRLLGRSPLAAIWDRRVLEIHFRAWTTNPARDEAWLELRGELTRVEYQRYRRALDRQYPDLLDSGDDEKERQVLRSIVDRAVEALQAKLAVAQERALAEADRNVACLSFDDSHTGELLRRYSTSSQRAMVKSLEAFAKLRRKTKDDDREPRREAREFRDPSGPGPWDEIYDTPNEGYVAEMERRARMAAQEAYGRTDEWDPKSESLHPKSEIGQHTREYCDSFTDPTTDDPWAKSELGRQATEGCLDPQAHDSQPATERDPGLFDPTSTIARLVTIDPNHTIAPGHPEPVDSMESTETELEPSGREVAGFSAETKNHEVAEFPSEPNEGEVAEFPNEPSEREVAGIPPETKNDEVAEFPNEPSEGEVAPSQGQAGDRDVIVKEADPVRRDSFVRELVLSALLLLAGFSSGSRFLSDHKPLDVFRDFESATPGERDTRPAVPVIVHDAGARLVLEADVLAARRPQAGTNRLGGVDLGALEGRQEIDATAIHLADRLVVRQPDVQVPEIGLGQTTQDQHVPPARHDEHEAPLSALSVVGDAMGLGDPWDRGPIVPDTDQRTAQRIHRVVRELPGPQASAIDDRIDSKLPGQLLLLPGERAGDPGFQDAAARTSGLAEQPRHVLIGVDHRREMRIRVLQTQLGIDAILRDQRGVMPEPVNLVAKLVHLLAVKLRLPRPAA